MVGLAKARPNKARPNYNTKHRMHPTSSSPICLWLILQTSQRADDEVTEEDHLPMQMQVSSCCSTVTKE